MNKNIIIFGGTFDPIHSGHLFIAKEASKKYQGKVIFVPNSAPRWKNKVASNEDRFLMLAKALKKYGDFPYEISRYELDKKEEFNYTIDTLNYYVNQYPDSKFFLLIGSDQVNKFHEWKKAKEISSLTKIIYFERYKEKPNLENVKTYKMEKVSGKVINISSTDIRTLEKVDTLDIVREHIEDNRLYYVNQMTNYISVERLDHSIQVARLAYQVALSNKLDFKDRVYVAAILHDIGKSNRIKKEEEKKKMEEFYPNYIDLPPFSFHQFLGEKIAREDFRIENEEILDAIMFHCTGKANMSPIGKIVYLSDKIEPTRGFDSYFLIESALKNYEQGFIDTVIDNKKYLISHDKNISNRLTDACFKMYIDQNKKGV